MDKEKLAHCIKHPEILPERAYVQKPSEPEEVIIVVNGETGYYHYQKYPNAIMAKETCDFCNSSIAHATEEEAKALLILSMRNKR